MVEISSEMANLIDFNSCAFKSDYLQLIETIKANFEQLPDVKVVEELVYKRTK